MTLEATWRTALCKHCGDSIRELDADSVVGVGPDADGREPEPGYWAALATGIDCPGTDDRTHQPGAPGSSNPPIPHRREATLVTPEARAIATELLPAVTPVLERLDVWRTAHPNIVDYRIEQARKGIRVAVDLLTRLDTGQDPELQAALATFRDRFPESDYTQYCDQLAVKGTGFGVCDAPLDEHGNCRLAGEHAESRP